MSSETPETPALLGEISQGPSAFEQFLDRNQKGIVILAIVIAVATAAYVVISGIEQGRQESAGAAFTQAEDLKALESLIAEHGGTRAADSAALLLADQQWQDGKQDEAITTLQNFLSANPKHAAAATAKASLASRLMLQGKAAEAVTTFQEIAEDPASRHLAPYALICIGDIAAAAGDTAKAKDAYTRVTAEFPKSNFLDTANTRLSHLHAAAPVAIDPPPAAEPSPPAAGTPPASPQNSDS